MARDVDIRPETRFMASTRDSRAHTEEVNDQFVEALKFDVNRDRHGL